MAGVLATSIIGLPAILGVLTRYFDGPKDEPVPYGMRNYGP